MCVLAASCLLHGQCLCLWVSLEGHLETKVQVHIVNEGGEAGRRARRGRRGSAAGKGVSSARQHCQQLAPRPAGGSVARASHYAPECGQSLVHEQRVCSHSEASSWRTFPETVVPRSVSDPGPALSFHSTWPPTCSPLRDLCSLPPQVVHTALQTPSHPPLSPF